MYIVVNILYVVESLYRRNKVRMLYLKLFCCLNIVSDKEMNQQRRKKTKFKSLNNFT
jgi:hypothetical protein